MELRILTRIVACFEVVLLSALLAPVQGTLPLVVPKDATARIGQTAQFDCQPNQVTEELKWFIYNNQPTDQKIFYTKNGNAPTFLPEVDTKKFGSNGTYSLVVKDLKVGDSATFSCSVSAVQEAFANLIVIDSLKATVTPISRLGVGSNVMIYCNLIYGAPSRSSVKKPLAEDHDPQLRLLIGQRDLNAPVYITQPGEKVAIVNITIQSEDLGHDLHCEMSSTASGVKTLIYSNVSLNLPSSILGVNTTKFDVMLNEVVLCSAAERPMPYVRWVPVRNTGTDSETDETPGYSLLTLDHVGKDIIWNCSQDMI